MNIREVRARLKLKMNLADTAKEFPTNYCETNNLVTVFGLGEVPVIVCAPV